MFIRFMIYLWWTRLLNILARNETAYEFWLVGGGLGLRAKKF